jgi:hypothetical protein
MRWVENTATRIVVVFAIGFYLSALIWQRRRCVHRAFRLADLLFVYPSFVAGMVRAMRFTRWLG